MLKKKKMHVNQQEFLSVSSSPQKSVSGGNETESENEDDKSISKGNISFW